MKHREAAQKIDRLIVEYNTEQALQELSKIVLQEIPDSERRTFSGLARRLGQNKLATKIIYPVIDRKGWTSELDTIEFATSLRRLGMVHQCRKILGLLADSSEKFLHLGFSSVQHWEFERAQTEFETALKLIPKEKRTHLLAQLNWVSCLVCLGNYQDSLKTIIELKQQTQGSYAHLFLNCLELEGQILYKQGRTKESLAVLDQASRLAEHQPGLTLNQIKKWQILSHLKSKSLPKDSVQIQEFRNQLRASSDWESLRHFDLELGLISEDSYSLRSLCFSSPFQGLRALSKVQLPPFMSRIDPRYSGPRKAMNPLTAIDLSLPFALAEHRMLLILLSDKYQPWSTHRIFDFFYEDEFFDPFVSPKKIYQILRRLEITLKKVKGLEFSQKRSSVRLRPKNETECYVFQEMIFKTSHELWHFLLQFYFSGRPFSLKEIHSRLPQVSHSKIQRQIQQLAAEGIFTQLGSKSTRQFVLK